MKEVATLTLTEDNYSAILDAFDDSYNYLESVAHTHGSGMAHVIEGKIEALRALAAAFNDTNASELARFEALLAKIKE